MRRFVTLAATSIALGAPVALAGAAGVPTLKPCSQSGGAGDQCYLARGPKAWSNAGQALGQGPLARPRTPFLNRYTLSYIRVDVPGPSTAPCADQWSLQAIYRPKGRPNGVDFSFSTTVTTCAMGYGAPALTGIRGATFASYDPTLPEVVWTKSPVDDKANPTSGSARFFVLDTPFLPESRLLSIANSVR